MTLPILHLNPKREKSILNRHPWIFSGAVKKVTKGTAEGDIVEVQSAEGQVLGYGFYSSRSQISCRMFDWSREPQDFESTDYWLKKIETAYKLRKQLVADSGTNSYRLIHAEGDFLPGLIIDIYANVAVAQVLILGIEKRKIQIAEALAALGFNNIYIKAKTSSQVLEDVRSDSDWLAGTHISPVDILENGLKFKVDFVEGQKTGFFIDQRDNRALLGQLSKDKKVLNAFSYSGGFSVYALAGGATDVHSLDISQSAMDMAVENIALNFPDAPHKPIVQDCFEFLREMEANYYDIIVLDPPAFAKHARAVENASRGYKQINMHAFAKIKPGGLVFTFSCSQNISKDLFQKIVFGAAADAGRNVRIIHQLHQPADHPINIFHPEGEYLKGLVLWVE